MEKREEDILHIINNYNVKRISFKNDEFNSNYINEYVNHIYVINLESDRIRRNYIIKVMEKYNINFELIIVPNLGNDEYNRIGNKYITKGEAGCYLSHMFCLNDAIANNYDKIIIFEDDIILHKEFNELFENIMTKNNYDILFLGASDFHFSKTNYKKIDKINNVYKPELDTIFLCGTYGIFYSNEGYKRVFKARLEKPTHMDNQLIEFCKVFPETFKISFPNLIASDVSTTTLNHSFWINNILRDNYYYRNCFNNRLNFNNYNFIYLGLIINAKINDKISYKENMTKIISKTFIGERYKIDTVSKRLVYDFFTLDDLLFIMNN